MALNAASCSCKAGWKKACQSQRSQSGTLHPPGVGELKKPGWAIGKVSFESCMVNKWWFFLSSLCFTRFTGLTAARYTPSASQALLLDWHLHLHLHSTTSMDHCIVSHWHGFCDRLNIYFPQLHLFSKACKLVPRKVQAMETARSHGLPKDVVSDPRGSNSDHWSGGCSVKICELTPALH